MRSLRFRQTQTLLTMTISFLLELAENRTSISQTIRANTTMKTIIYIVSMAALISCNSGKSQTLNNNRMIEQTELTNPKVNKYVFLDCMYQDSYFPKYLVDKCKNILLELCYNIETSKPSNLDQLYNLTHSSTDKLNDLQDEFFENNSEIETGARECLAENFEFIAEAFDFDADIEELIATRDW